MSGYQGNGGNWRGGRGGRSGGGRGGRSGGRGGRSGGRGPREHQTLGRPAIKLCNVFMTGRTCKSGNNCSYEHAIQLVSTVNDSNEDKKASSQKNSYNNYNNNNNNNRQGTYYPTSDLALWMDTPESPLQIFTSSHDGHWRLYNTQNGQAQKNFEHNMNGQVNTLHVAHNFLFCGFEGECIKIPNQKVGMIYAWNLNNQDVPPMELHMMGGDDTSVAGAGAVSGAVGGSVTSSLAPYAHSKAVTSLITQDDVCFSGGLDHMIRIWKFDATMNQTKGGFKLLKECCGHVGSITGLVFLNGMLWSASTDGTIRLWDSNSNWECKHLIAGSSATPNAAAAGGVAGANGTPNQGVGHTAAITALLHFQIEQGGGSFILSSSLDGDIKIWDSANGNCLSTTPHGNGIVSMALSKNVSGQPILICGTEQGKIIIRGLVQTAKTAPMAFLCSIVKEYEHCGHSGPVNSIVAGPADTNYANTFFTAGGDGTMLIWQISGNLGMS